MPRHALHGWLIEQRRGVIELCRDTFVVLDGVQGQVELRRLALPGNVLDQQARQATLRTCGDFLVVVHDLEQRAVAQAALRVQRLDQLFERQVLVGLGILRHLARLGQQVAEVHKRTELGLEHLGVDEKADQPLGFDTVAVRDRDADADVILPTVPMQQGLEAGQQQREECRTLLLRQSLEGIGQTAFDLKVHAGALETLVRWARAVAGQLENRVLGPQVLLPERQLSFLLPRFHPVPLPDGIVGVLDRHLGKREGLAHAVMRVVLDQLFDHQVHRRAVSGDMVQRNDQHMIIFCYP